MNVLAVGAHPDDIEIYMYGTLAACAARGDRVVFAIATDGAAGGKQAPEKLRRIRQDEALAAAGLIGATPHFLDFPDGALVADATLIAALKRLIVETSPDLVITHAPNDYHADHRALSEALRIATNFHAPLLYVDTMQGVGFVPTHYVDITAHVEVKAAAILAHTSQLPQRYVDMAAQLASFRASQCNMRAGGFAEAFRFEPVYPYADIRELLPPAPPVRPLVDRRTMPG
jgi:LmbE family N-acetylglucosaminyl deacetylase